MARFAREAIPSPPSLPPCDLFSSHAGWASCVGNPQIAAAFAIGDNGGNGPSEGPAKGGEACAHFERCYGLASPRS